MRAIADQNIERACQLGYAPACRHARTKSAGEDAPPDAQEGPLRITPEALREQGLPAAR